MDKYDIEDWRDVVKWLKEDIWHEIFVYGKDAAYQFLDFAYSHPDFVDVDIDQEELDYQISKLDFSNLPVAGFWIEDGCTLQILAHSLEEINTESRFKGIGYRYLIRKLDIKIEANPDEFINLLSIQR